MIESSFLEEGQIVEEGSHEDLMAQKGQYMRMFREQSKYYRDEETL